MGLYSPIETPEVSATSPQASRRDTGHPEAACDGWLRVHWSDSGRRLRCSGTATEELPADRSYPEPDRSVDGYDHHQRH